MKEKSFAGLAALLCGLFVFFSVFEAASQVRFYGGTGFGGTHDFDLVEIDPSTGDAATVVEGTYWTGLDFTPDRQALYGVSSRLYSIDIAAGTYTEIGPLTFQGSDPISMRSMTIAADAEMYVLSSSSSDPAGESRYYRVDKTTGNLEYLGTPEGIVWGIEFAPDGTLYGAAFDLMVLDPTDGSTLQTIGSLDSSLLINELDVSEDETLYGTDYESGLYQIDMATGAATLLTTYSGNDQVWSLATKGAWEFRISKIHGVPPGIEWQSAVGQNYKIWASADLLTWVSASSPLPGSASGTTPWTDDGQHDLGPASEARLRFYRVEHFEGPVEPTVRFYGGTGFGGTNDFDLVEIDPSSGATSLALEGTYWTGLDFTPDGSTLYGVSSRLYTIDIAGGTYSDIGPLTYEGSEPISMSSMTIAPDGQMYALSNSFSDPAEESRFYRIDKATGNLEYLGSPEGMIWAIEFAPDGTIYGAGFDLMKLDTSNGAVLETIGSLDSTLLLNELDFATDGNLYGTDADGGLYKINTATGRASLITRYTTGDEVWSLVTQRR